MPHDLISESRDPNFYLIRGVIFKQRGFMALAKKNLQKALDLSSGLFHAAFHLRVVCLETGDFERSAGLLKTAYEALYAEWKTERDSDETQKP